MTRREAVASIDYETRSACDLKKSGSWMYSLHPSTEVLCLAFRLPHWAPGRTALWHPSFLSAGIPACDTAELSELFDWIWASRPVEAHNAWFERGIWTNIAVARDGWPEIAPWQWRCSAAKAAAHTLPRGLGDLAIVLGLKEQKDKAGHALMMKLSKPRKPRKAERAAWLAKHGPDVPHEILWWESADLFNQLFAYCRQDVLTEAAASEAVPDLIASELDLYLLDQEINERGFQFDAEAVSCALALVKAETPKLNKELERLTGGVVQKATQRAKMTQWFSSQGLELPNMQKETVEDLLLTATLKMPVRRGLELVQMLGKSSTAKYQSMAHWMNPDGRVRGSLLFHGASTGRWTAAGIQPQNFVRGFIKNMPALWDVLKTKDRNKIQAVVRQLSYGKCNDVLAALSQALRGCIISPPGRELFVCDYSGIEARVVMWLAGDDDALGIFRRHEDIYKEMASSIYNVPTHDVTPSQRQVGKFSILGLGFQMGWSKFQATCEKFGVTISDDFSKGVVDAYRERFWRVKQSWQDQQEAAIAAVQTGEVVPCGRVEWEVIGDYLYCLLPSGRRLAYPEPEMRMWDTSWGDKKMTLTFTGVSPYTRKWTRQSAYGGLLVQGQTQATARDVMVGAVGRCAESKYDVVLSVHDELIAEADEGVGSVGEFCAIVARTPDWAPGLPIDVEGWKDTRYHK